MCPVQFRLQLGYADNYPCKWNPTGGELRPEDNGKLVLPLDGQDRKMHKMHLKDVCRFHRQMQGY